MQKMIKTIKHQGKFFFFNSKLNLIQILTIYYCLFFKLPQTLAEPENELGDGTKNRGRNTIVDWYNSFRDVCRESLYQTSSLIGGEAKVVEIDESAFGKRKYN